MAAQLDTSFGGYKEYSFPHYEANLNRGRDVSIPMGIHPDYTVKEKSKNVDGYDTGDPESILPANLVNAVTTRSMAKDVEKSNQAQVQPDGNQGKEVKESFRKKKWEKACGTTNKLRRVSGHTQSDTSSMGEPSTGKTTSFSSLM
uniref:Uncharacterized protein n=1 Tax=Romanomermis culicivorax TaxID=13658 RepID=A0A915J1Q5_ROMCU